MPGWVWALVVGGWALLAALALLFVAGATRCEPPRRNNEDGPPPF